MLSYAKSLVNKPFSNIGMARSIIYPRTTTEESFFCAELVAAVLKKGGLMSPTSNPGAATPESLYQLYKSKAAVTGNPFVLRSFSSLSKVAGPGGSGVGFGNILDKRSQPERPQSLSNTRHRNDSPPRARFVPVLNSGVLATDNLVLLRR